LLKRLGRDKKQVGEWGLIIRGGVKHYMFYVGGKKKREG